MRIQHLTIALAAILPSGTCLAQSGNAYLTPSRMDYIEQLPDNYSSIDFNVYKDDWMDRVRLPARAAQSGAMSVMITHHAGKIANLDVLGCFTHLPQGVGRITLPPGTWLDLDKRSNGWQVGDSSIRNLTPLNMPRWWIPAMGRRMFTTVSLHDGLHAGEIGLPTLGNPFDTVTISNHATWPSHVIGSNMLFPNAQSTLRTGDVHHYVFDPNHRRWKLDHANPVRVSIARHTEKPEAPRTIVEVAPGDSNRSLRLPREATDRDRRTISVHPALDHSIALGAPNIFDHANAYWMIEPGQSMELVYVDDGGVGSGQWHPLRYPVPHFDVDALPDGRLDNAQSMLTRITSKGRNVSLPLALNRMAEHARVEVINTDPNASIRVTGSSLDTLKRREQASFRAIKVNGRLDWVRETDTIDVTLVGPPGPGRPDEDILVLMRENLRKTNEALQNSGATFRLREAVAMNKRVPAGLPTHAIPEWLTQQPDYNYLVSLYHSDGLYYGGFAEGCGGSHNSAETKHFVIATNVLCSTDVLREEVGRALGMKINGRQPVPVIGSGNALPMYPTSARILEDGSRAINHGQHDEVLLMNGVASGVARYSDYIKP